MDSYVKTVLFAVVLVVIAWDITSGAGVIPPQGTSLVSNNKAVSSASFIQQESNVQPLPSGLAQSGTASSTRTQVAPPQPNSRVPIPTSISPSNNRGSTRDFVNPQSNLQAPTGQNTPNRNVQSQPNLPVQSSSGNNRGGTRDYVNPQAQQIGHIRPQNPTGSPPNSPSRNVQTQPNYPVQGNSGNNREGTRDYVNPQAQQIGQVRPQPQHTQSGGSAQNIPNINGQSSPSNSGSASPTSNSRTVIPASGPQRPNSYASVTNTNTNVRDYVAPQRPAFPPLPGSSGTGGNPPQSGIIQSPTGPTTPISYANKVSGGVTTKSPIATPKSSPAGPLGGSTTEKPKEGPTDVELRDFSEALLRRDVNNAAKYITANYQGKTTSQSLNDEAPQKLLEIKPEAYQISTISKLKLLHNNYILETNENEHVTAQEKSEENELLDAMLTTPIMQYTRNFLISKDRISKDPKDFKDLLKILWFNMYSRGGGRIGSSGFEHIFLAELKKNEISGMHNWVYFDQAEMSKLIDYLGYMKKIDLGEKGAILKFRFKLKGIDKPVDSMFIGTSPELELALYTTCYLFRVDRVCPLRLNGNNFIIRTYNFRYRGKNMIGSAFPEI